MDLSLEELKGIGPKRREALENAGIHTARDLVCYLPREYRDLTDVRPLALLRPGEGAAVRVRVIGGVSMTRFRGLVIVRARLEDASGKMQAVWYNQSWLKQQLVPGRELLLYGRVEMQRGQRVLVCPSIEKENVIRPEYKPIAGIPNKTLAECIDSALTAMDGHWSEDLPAGVRQRAVLCERNYAYLNAHHPLSREALDAARRRFAYEELLLYQVGLGLTRGSRGRGEPMDCPDERAEEFWRTLPFAPTGAQKRVLREILADLRAPQAMARLVQGDVGSGKTALAFGAMYACVKAGYQCALMAPTEILAQQHYESARAVLEPLGVRCGLLTGSTSAKGHREAREKLESGEWQAVVGTHALITENVTYQKLGLVITDEQHRFGVRQRTLLSEKGQDVNVLVMSATPIPRTLALILYGDLDISLLDELPPGRTPVTTRIVPEEKREAMYGFLREQVKAGRQVYVVCPLIEESEVMPDARTAESVYRELRDEKLPDLRVALVHGRMKPKEKEAVLSGFHSGEIDVLVSTTVIEVGVNVPNASVMVIEDADRFGLAQLHQLRGRVGRGAALSYCFLMAQPNERLRLMTKTNDGFVIAQKDMELRGPGELFGFRQTGEAAIGLAACAGDTVLLHETHEMAQWVLRSPDDPEARQVARMAQSRFAEQIRQAGVN